MSKPKILIEIRGGNVVSVHSTQEIGIVIIDYDNETPLRMYNDKADVFCEDSIFGDGEAHTLFSDSTDPVEIEIREELKRIKF